MADQAGFIPRFPEGEVSADARAMIAQLADQNALLRASLVEARERLGELEQIADTDTLTPLPNRRRFIRELERVTAQASRHGTQAAVLYIDLECLNAVNDKHGHFAGDAALIHVARLLGGLIRANDFAARIGGDEFALILDHLDHNSAIDTAERIARYIASVPLDLGGSLVMLTASIGIASVLAGDSVDDVLRRADRNIGRAKSRD
ncbi:MAG TPA: GGDEF domain-containing protein [Allosphingosinicella sp.]|jgi:diguanylate cyclase (GGDEF)-like protein|uniref:GGDEF domain-containing protein n=1 Tax=Allosphingosinicella sp. TaxID=2823234 RepID=UPI002F298294